MFIEYVMIFKYFIFSFIIAIILLSLSYFLVYQNPNSEKLSIYDVDLLLLKIQEVVLK
jgi:hypothetical protein